MDIHKAQTFEELAQYWHERYVKAQQARNTLRESLREAHGRLRCQWAIQTYGCQCEHCELRERITTALKEGQ